MPGRFSPPRRRRIPIYVCPLLLLIILGLGCLVFWWQKPKYSWKTYQNKELGIKFDWLDNFQASALTAEDQDSGVVFKIERAKPDAQVFLRYEGDLGPIRFTGKTILDYLVEVIDRAYPKRFPDYRKESYREFVLAGQNVAEFTFTYLGKDKEGGEVRIKQRYMVVVKDDENIAFFLSLQSPEKEFSKSEKDFGRIIDSFEFL